MTNKTKASNINYRLPQVDQLLNAIELQPYIHSLSRPVVKTIIQSTLNQIRQSDEFKQLGCDAIDIFERLIKHCHHTESKKLQPVINGTGTVIHTNLGRSPINSEVWDSVRDVNTSYNNLELQLETGKRGGRKGLICELLHELTGADDGLVVNNNAASIYLILHELAKGKEVIISRGELVQIGGGFRIPDILALTGAKLVEVGTTNITTAEDYLQAITEDTALILMVHQSNFAIRGFTQSPNIAEVAKQKPDHIVLAVDQGSGLTNESLSNEETSVSQYIKWGADLVCFSGDKILGGPQAGIVTGKSHLIAQLEKNPMMRTFRPSRIIYSLLEELLKRKLNGEINGQGVAQNTINNKQVTYQQAQALVKHFPDHLTLSSAPLVIGGGTLPDVDYASHAVIVECQNISAEKISQTLRQTPIPVITTIQNNQVLCHLATVNAEDFPMLEQQLEHCFKVLSS